MKGVKGFALAALSAVGLASAANDVVHFTPTKPVTKLFGGISIGSTTTLFYSTADGIFSASQVNGEWAQEVAVQPDGQTSISGVGGSVYKGSAVVGNTDPFGLAVLGADKTTVTLYPINSSGAFTGATKTFTVKPDAGYTDISLVSATATVGDFLLATFLDSGVCKVEVSKLALSSEEITATAVDAAPVTGIATSCEFVGGYIDNGDSGAITAIGEDGTSFVTYGTFSQSDGFKAGDSFVPLEASDFSYASPILTTTDVRLFGSALNSKLVVNAGYSVGFTSPFLLGSGSTTGVLSGTFAGTSLTPFDANTVLPQDECGVSIALNATDAFSAQFPFVTGDTGGYNVTFVGDDLTEAVSFINTYAKDSTDLKIDRSRAVGTLLADIPTFSASTKVKGTTLNVVVDRNFVEYDVEGHLFGAVAISRQNRFTKVCLQSSTADSVSVSADTKIVYLAATNPNGASAVLLKSLSGLAAAFGLTAAALLL